MIIPTLLASVGSLLPLASVGSLLPLASVGSLLPLAGIGSLLPLAGLGSLLPLAGLGEVLGIIFGVLLAPGGFAVAVLGLLAAVDGAPKRGLTSVVVGLAVGALGVWLIR